VIRPVDVKGSARMRSSGGWTARLSASMRRTSSTLEKRMARGLSWYLDIVRLKRTGRVEGYDQHRVFGYAKPNKMMNEAEKHLKKYAPEDEVPHPQCKAAGLVLPSVMGFKNHTATVHKIFLRA